MALTQAALLSYYSPFFSFPPGATTVSITTSSITTPSIMGLTETLSTNDIQHKRRKFAVMPSVVLLNVVTSCMEDGLRSTMLYDAIYEKTFAYLFFSHSLLRVCECVRVSESVYVRVSVSGWLGECV